MNRQTLARAIDHTQLKPGATDEDIRRLCQQAAQFGFASVCVMPYYVPYAWHLLQESGTGNVAVCAPIGFPSGAHQSVVKAAEARKALHDGATELDMVINTGALLSGHYQLVMADIMAVVMTAHETNMLVKVILETALLNDHQKRIACELATKAEADFVKTCTGFAGGGASVQDVRLMRAAIAPHMRVKASGGIRDLQAALQLMQAGADRIGTSSGVQIIQEMPADAGGL